MVLFPRIRIRTSLIELQLQSRFPPRRSKYRRGETSDENREPLLLGAAVYPHIGGGGGDTEAEIFA